jgi:DNA-binding CsgD family transcriptional regulator
VFVGRRSECETLDRLLEDARAGRSGVLVMRGEPGVGKTALLEYAIDSAADLRVARAVGVESEMELAYAALHQVCAPMLDRLERLPAPQRDALGTAFGLSAGTTPDRFLVSLAVLSLLSEAAETQPLVCLIDDAQWLDRASAKAFAFVARRLLAESVAIVFAAREPIDELRGLRELVVGGLRDSDARELLAFAVRGPLDEQVRERVVAETRGNPLALLELPRGLEAAELAGGFGSPSMISDPRSLPRRIEDSFLRRLETLPADTKLLCLVAAAEPVGDPGLVWRAAGLLGITPEALAPAVAAELLRVGTRVLFRHALVRSAVYRAASPADRRRVHKALADVTEPGVDPDRRAWHRAEAAAGPDEEVAAELERSAGRAQARGGLAAAAAFLEQATALTPDPARRGMRALVAAEAMLRAGAFDTALALLTTAEEAPLDALPRARIDLLRAQIAFASRHASEAAPLLLAAARRLEPLDDALARETYLEAISAAMFAGRLAGGIGAAEVAQAARRFQSASHPSCKGDLLLHGLTVRFTDGCAVAAPIEQSMLRAFRSDDLTVEEGLRWLWLASATAADLWDDESWSILSAHHVNMARASGALSELPLALNSRAVVHVFAGEFDAAGSVVQELNAVQQATGTNLAPYGALGLAAWRGREQEADDLIEATVGDVVSRGEGIGVTITQWAKALLLNGLGKFQEAVLAARQAAEDPRELAAANWGLSELVEAAARSHDREVASNALRQLADRTRASGTDWALGVEARSRALLDEAGGAESLYREAIDRLERTRVQVELARARLLYGEWLRRQRRRLEARDQLRTAHEMFTTMSAEAFAGRAARELLATGERARKRSVETREDLTAQELQVARLARDGLSNPEIGTRLFISPRTVEYHLHKVFTKLQIASRIELKEALPSERQTALVS